MTIRADEGGSMMGDHPRRTAMAINTRPAQGDLFGGAA
jgi:hypothetical protein